MGGPGTPHRRPQDTTLYNIQEALGLHTGGVGTLGLLWIICIRESLGLNTHMDFNIPCLTWKSPRNPSWILYMTPDNSHFYNNIRTGGLRTLHNQRSSGLQIIVITIFVQEASGLRKVVPISSHIHSRYAGVLRPQLIIAICHERTAHFSWVLSVSLIDWVLYYSQF